MAGFSIDDILSHKTAQAAAAIREQQRRSKKQRLMIDVEGDESDGDEDDVDEEDEDDERAAIVRPWDKAEGAAEGPASRRKSVGDSSPLDALFQMASKTFEGLKAKSGKIIYFENFIFDGFDTRKKRHF